MAIMEQKDKNAYLRRLDRFTPDMLLGAPRYSLVSLFCGGGGLDLGLGFAGFESLVATDLTPTYVETVTNNIPSACGFSYDALRITPKLLYERSGTKEIDLLVAGPPCQSFSILGLRKAFDDPRGKMALRYFELVSDLQPRAFLFENVPGLLTVERGEVWKQLYQYAQDTTGYFLHFKKINSVVFGIPQYRERIILVGFRQDTPFEFPTTATGAGADALLCEGHAATPSKWALEAVEGVPNHVKRKHGKEVLVRYSTLQPGKRDRGGFNDRLDPECPAGTVLAGSSVGGSKPHIHPYEHRVITVREAARLQSFPDWYTFCGTPSEQYRQVGNAVPPLMAYEIGKNIIKALGR